MVSPALLFAIALVRMSLAAHALAVASALTVEIGVLLATDGDARPRTKRRGSGRQASLNLAR